jgi:hypothetical protein
LTYYRKFGKNFEVRLTLKPGEKGRRKLAEKYSDSPVCVRYRYDKPKNKKYKTVEIIVEESDWQLEKTEVLQDKKVYVKLHLDEKDIQKKVWKLGGIYNPNKIAWKLSFQKVLELGLL